jgi:ComF family protein
VSTNYEFTAQKLIKIYKFGHQRPAAESLAELMVKTLLKYNDTDDLHSLNYVIVPVPTASSRIRQRGFDHSAHLARQVAIRLHCQFSNALIRLGQTRQVGAERTVRLHQPFDNYLVRYRHLVEGQNILLVDDVVTTGATLRAATRALRAAGAARVDALVFAKKL